MRRLVAAAACCFVLVCGRDARADMPGPHDDECTLAFQGAWGGTCEECAQSVGDDPATWCAVRMKAKGLSQRCHVGATHQRSIWCDRPAPPLRLALGVGLALLALTAGLITWWRRRRSRSA